MKSYNKKLRHDLTDRHGKLLFMDGYDHCIAGICTRQGQDQSPIVIYDYKKGKAK